MINLETNNQDDVSNSQQRIGYIYLKHRKNEVNYVVTNKVLNIKDLERINKSVSVILNLQPILFALNGIERSHQELIDTINDQQVHLNDLGKENLNILPISDVLKGKLAITHKIMNFLCSTSAFLDHTRIQLENHISQKASLELKEWNEFRNKLHSSNFSYRFIYELRNFSQHHSIPFNSYVAEGKYELDNNYMIFMTRIIICRDQLLKDGKNYFKKSKQDLMKNHPSLIYYLISMNICSACVNSASKSYGIKICGWWSVVIFFSI